MTNTERETAAKVLAMVDGHDWKTLRSYERIAYGNRVDVEGFRPSAHDRRYLAIRDVTDKYVYPGGVVIGERADIATAIRALESMGRTDRWARAITQWANMVCDTNNDLHWAIVQGNIYAGHAA